MWLVTQHGFASVVKARDGRIQVRARRKEDIHRLADLCATTPQIIRTKNRDYLYRFYLEPSEFAAMMAEMALAVDYTNFKNHVHDTYPSNTLWGVYRAIDAMDDRGPPLSQREALF